MMYNITDNVIGITSYSYSHLVTYTRDYFVVSVGQTWLTTRPAHRRTWR